ncbi:MAG: VWA domain-containing protein [Treponema sp.]|nr:VWA domain-containing protein [Treponema sp.]
MPDFQNPAAFLLLLLIPALYVLRSLGLFTRISFPVTLADWNGSVFEWKNGMRSFISHISRAIAIAGFIAGIAALADPVIYHQEKIYTSRGTDILFVVDTSPSMAVKDIAGGISRFNAARQSIRALIQDNSGVSFGLVAMGTEAAVVVPPTMDHDMFLSRLDSLVVGNLGDGSAIGTGLSTAVYHLVSSSAPKKCIVLITDGENNAGAIHPETAAELAEKNNILLYTLGIGTRGTVPLDYVDPKTGKVYSGYLESNFDPAPLKQLALSAGGRYYGVQTVSDLANALSAIGRDVTVIQTYRMKAESERYYDRFILVSALLFIAAWLIRRLYLQEFV